MRPTRCTAMILMLAIITAACAPSGSGEPSAGTVPIARVAAEPPTGTFTTAGFFVDDGSGPRLCELLAESYPPQCAGAAVTLRVDDVALPTLSRADGVTWSDAPVTIVGRMDRDILVVEAVTR